MRIEIAQRHQLQHAEHAVHRRADLVAHHGEEARFGHAGALQLQVRLLELRGSLAHAPLEVLVEAADFLVRGFERRGAPLDLGEHFVERVYKGADLVAGGAIRPHRVVALFHHFAGERGNLDDRAGDAALQPSGEQGGHHQCGRHHGDRDRDVASDALVHPEILREVDRPHDLVVRDDAAKDLDAIAANRDAVRPGKRGNLAFRDTGPQITCEQGPAGVVDRADADVRAGLEEGEVLRGDGAVVELQGGRGGVSHELRFDRQIGGAGLPVAEQVIQEEAGTRNKERDKAREEHRREELLAHGGEGDARPSHCEATWRATRSSWEPSCRPFRSAASLEMSKRIRSSLARKLMTLPFGCCASTSVTVSTGCPCAPASNSAVRPRSPAPMKRIWQHSPTESPRANRRTVTGLPAMVRPTATCSSSCAIASDPATPMTIGVSGWEKTRAGHSTYAANL